MGNFFQFLLASLFLFSAMSLTTSPHFEAFISNETFLDVVNECISKALKGQNLANNTFFFNTTFDKITVIDLNLTIQNLSNATQISLGNNSLNLLIPSVSLDFLLNFKNSSDFNQSMGNLDFESSLTVFFTQINDTLSLQVSQISIQNFEFTFYDNLSSTNHSFLKSLLENNNNVLGNIISLEINNHFRINAGITYNKFMIHDVVVTYSINVTNVAFSTEGLKLKLSYSILSAQKVDPTDSTRLRAEANGNLSRNPEMLAKNLKLPLQFLQDLSLQAHQMHFFNYSFNENNSIEFNGFSFYIGDLAFAIPSLQDEYYPDTRVDVKCESFPDSVPNVQLGNNPVLMEIAYLINCTIYARKSPDNPDASSLNADNEIISFSPYLHAFLNLEMDSTNHVLRFSVNNLQTDGDIRFSPDAIITAKRGKEILSSWIQNAVDFYKSMKAPFGSLTLPISENDTYTLKYENSYLLICSQENSHPCFSDNH